MGNYCIMWGVSIW